MNHPLSVPQISQESSAGVKEHKFVSAMEEQEITEWPPSERDLCEAGVTNTGTGLLRAGAGSKTSYQEPGSVLHAGDLTRARE